MLKNLNHDYGVPNQVEHFTSSSGHFTHLVQTFTLFCKHGYYPAQNNFKISIFLLRHTFSRESLEFFLNGAELSLNSVISVNFRDFRESDKSLKHELGSI